MTNSSEDKQMTFLQIFNIFLVLYIKNNVLHGSSYERLVQLYLLQANKSVQVIHNNHIHYNNENSLDAIVQTG